MTPSTPADAKGLLKTAIRDDNPVDLPRERDDSTARSGEVPEEEYLIPLGEGDVKRAGKDVTHDRVVEDGAARGAQGRRGAREGRDRGEVVDPRTLRPLDEDADLRVGAQDRPLRDRRGGLAGLRASAPRSRTGCSKPASTTSTRRSSASPRDDVPMPYAQSSRRTVHPQRRTTSVQAVARGALRLKTLRSAERSSAMA